MDSFMGAAALAQLTNPPNEWRHMAGQTASEPAICRQILAGLSAFSVWSSLPANLFYQYVKLCKTYSDNLRQENAICTSIQPSKLLWKRFALQPPKAVTSSLWVEKWAVLVTVLARFADCQQ